MMGSVVAAMSVILCGCIGFSQPAQQPQAVGQPAGSPSTLKSPEVQPDGRVIFRFLAPQANKVTVSGDYPIGKDDPSAIVTHNTPPPAGGVMVAAWRVEVPMTKDDQGVWSVTIGPLKPEYYSYHFTADGVRALDPLNAFVNRGGSRYSNWFIVPGPGSMDYTVNDVPHGTVAQVWYPSR